MTSNTLRLVCAALALVGAASPWNAPTATAPQDPAPAPVPAQEPAEPSEPTIAVAAMLEGAWVERRAQAGGTSHVEEVWSAPAGDNVMGTFRWLAPDGSAAMYEILVLTAEKEGIFLRLRHFGPDLVAWEERDAPKTLRLARAEPRRLVFEAHAHCGDLARVTYDRSEEDVLAIEVAFEAEGGRPPLRFRLARRR